MITKIIIIRVSWAYVFKDNFKDNVKDDFKDNS